MQPFWEATYEDTAASDPFGSPSAEIIDLLPQLSPGASVLDLGCGAGRHAHFLAAQGYKVTALDVSSAAIRKLHHLAREQGLSIDARVADLRGSIITDEFDLIIAHGILHLLEPASRDRLLQQVQAHTAPGGYNVVAVFTDTLLPPDDLAPFTLGLFREGELFKRYAGWNLLEQRSYILHDEHPGGVRHQHPINKLVAQRPCA